jgi:hypothetical protein
MRNIAFAIWMVGYSFNMSWEINNWHSYPEWTGTITDYQFTALTINLILWIGIGALLYERNN